MTQRRRSFTCTSPKSQVICYCTPSGDQQLIPQTNSSFSLENLPQTLSTDSNSLRSNVDKIGATDNLNFRLSPFFHGSKQMKRIDIHKVKPKHYKKVKLQRLHHKNLKLKHKILKVLHFIEDIACPNPSLKSEEFPELLNIPLTTEFSKLAELQKMPSEEHKEPEIIRIDSPIPTPRQSFDMSNNFICPTAVARKIDSQLSCIPSKLLYEPKSEALQNKKSSTLSLMHLRESVLSHCKSWDFYSANTTEYIQALEDYKDAIAENAKNSYKFENSLKLFKERIKICKAQQKRQACGPENKEQNKIYDDDFASTGLDFWQNIDSFLMRITPDLMDTFVRFNNGSPLLNDDSLCKPQEQFLNLYAVNRMAAILKVYKYCNDYSCELSKFQDRVKANGNSYLLENATEATMKDEKYYPKASEFDYLLGLDSKKIYEEIDKLRELILKNETPSQMNEKEAELAKKAALISEQNQIIQSRIKARALNQKKILIKEDKSKTSLVSKKYQQMIPAMKRKHNTLIQEEEAILAGNLDNWIARRQKAFDDKFEKPDDLCTYTQDTRATPSSVTTTPPIHELFYGP